MGACISISEEVDGHQHQPQADGHPPAGPTLVKQGSSGRMRFSSRSVRDVASPPQAQARAFTYREVCKATRNFHHDGILGEGGFGMVYRGQLADGRLVAVKVLNDDGCQGEREWETEVRFLGQLSHPNLVRLLGYCGEGQHRQLLYEYMPNGSLEKWLFSRSREPLAWDVRMQIALDAARGLAFLHDAPNGGIIFRDLKPSNVLLDESFNAKLSDFGLAKDGPQGNKSHVSTRVMGTQGYAAPEYVFTGHLTVKSDIYTYGVVLLEIIAGRPSLDSSLPRHEQNLVQWARPLLADKAKLHRIVDRRLGNKFSMKALRRVVVLALNCLRKDANSRPAMSDVAKWLEPIQGLYEQEKAAAAAAAAAAASSGLGGVGPIGGVHGVAGASIPPLAAGQ